MACSGCGGGGGCNCGRGFFKVTSQSLQGTLARKLIPVADQLRNLYSVFGLRPYVVRIVQTQWSAGIRNQGTEQVISSMDLLPTPLLSDLTGVAEINTAIGLDEIGEVMVSQISGRYTEDQLRGFDASGHPIEKDESFYWECEFPTPGDGQGERRRFTIKAVPMFWSDKFQWTVRLEKARMDRSRDGTPR